MGYARKSLISLNDTPYYHYVARCVRRAWLWGVDEYAGCDYSHRKEWVLERLALLASIFTIEVCACAVMSNHYHLVLFVDQERARALTREEIIERWTRIFELKTGDGGRKTVVPLRAYASGSNDRAAIPYTLHNYRELVDCTGRAIRDEKLGFIGNRLPAIAQRLNIDAEASAGCAGPLSEMVALEDLLQA